MTIKDPFSYSARWSSVGLDCSHCIHFVGPSQWPDTERISRCALHNVSLAIELRKAGYKEGEWFCKEFTNNGKASSKAIGELETIQYELQEGVLYGAYGEGRILKEYLFASLESGKTIEIGTSA